MKAIIVGGGKVGYYLAKTLAEQNYEISLIEINKERSHECANKLEAKVNCADGTTSQALEASGAAEADVVIAVTGRDECNLVCCQTAKKYFNVKKTIAKVNNPKNTEVLKALDVDIVVSSTDNIIKQLEMEVGFSATKKLMDLDEDCESSIVEITLPQDYIYEGKRLRDMELPTDCNIACIHRDGKIVIPRGNTMLFSGDVVLAVALNAELKNLKKALKIKD